MAAPSESAKNADFIRYNVRVIARVEADPQTAHLAQHMQQPHDAFMATITARIAAENFLLKAEAKDDYARDKVIDLLGPFSLQVAAQFGSKDHGEVKRVLPHTPAQYAALKRDDQIKAFDALVEAVDDAATPAALKKFGKPVVDAVAAWTAQRKETAKAESTFAKAAKAVRDGKGPCLVGNGKIRNELGLLFPRQARKVSRYFPKKAPKTKEDGEEPGEQ